MDSVLFSDAGDAQMAGVYFQVDGQNIVWTDFFYKEDWGKIEVESTEHGLADVPCVTVRLSNEKYHAAITLYEKYIEIRCSHESIKLTAVYNADHAYGKTSTDNSTFENHNSSGSVITHPTSIKEKEDSVSFAFDGREYGLKFEKVQSGTVWKYTVVPCVRMGKHEIEK